VFLRCCTAYRGLLDRLGMAAHAPLQPRFDVTVLAPGKQAELKRRRLPAPLHLLPALLSYPFLNFSERMRLALAALAFRRLDEQNPKTDELSLGDWLAAHGQDERTRRVLWDLFSVSSLNVPGDDASLALAAVVVKTGLLGDADAADIGVPALSLGELHGAAAQRLLGRLGATVRLQAKVASIEPKGDQFLIRLAGEEGTDAASRAPDTMAGSAIGGAAGASGGSGGDVPPGEQSGGSSPREATDLLCDAVVLAVPHEQAAKLVPPGALPAETVDGWAGLGAAPIVNVHVIYDRKVMEVPFAAGVDSPVQWVFDRTRISGLHERATAGQHSAGQYLAISLSAADEYANRTVAELREQFVPALAELLPAAREATVTEFFVTREKRATFRQVPGTAKLRPRAATDLPGLVLAGAWTDTGWPDTMEGAVRSGLNAVIALHESAPRSASRAAVDDTVGASPAAGAEPDEPATAAELPEVPEVNAVTEVNIAEVKLEADEREVRS
jgi:hypothetical protein